VIADGNKCALIKRQRKFEKVSVDPVLSWQWLNFWKEARHPEYVNIKLPTQEELARELSEIERLAIDDVEYVSDSITILMESRIEDKGDGFSALIPTNDINMDSAAQIAGIAKLVDSAERLPTTSKDNNEEMEMEVNNTYSAERDREASVGAKVQNNADDTSIEGACNDTGIPVAQSRHQGILPVVTDPANLQAPFFCKNDRVIYTNACEVLREGMVTGGTSTCTYTLTYTYTYIYTYA
jgi:hypothetical protein